MGAKIKIISAIFFILMIAACETIAPNKNVSATLDNDLTIGWLHGNCIAIRNPNLKVPSEITLILLEQIKTSVKGVITKAATSSEACYALLDDRKSANTNNGYSFYLVDTEAPVNLAIGVLDNRNLEYENIDYCSTTEGISYTVKEKGRQIWSGYYFLGYDSEATCINSPE
ncbi:MAG: hypothetical protein ACJA0N_002529 [Pseudohongiellaceae bacterium]|jgi:hypothetical protein